MLFTTNCFAWRAGVPIVLVLVLSPAGTVLVLESVLVLEPSSHVRQRRFEYEYEYRPCGTEYEYEPRWMLAAGLSVAAFPLLAASGRLVRFLVGKKPRHPHPPSHRPKPSPPIFRIRRHTSSNVRVILRDQHGYRSPVIPGILTGVVSPARSSREAASRTARLRARNR